MYNVQMYNVENSTSSKLRIYDIYQNFTLIWQTILLQIHVILG